MLFIESVHVSGGTCFVVHMWVSLVRQLIVWIDLTEQKGWVRLLEYSNTAKARPIRELHDKGFEPQHGRKWPREAEITLVAAALRIRQRDPRTLFLPPLLYLILSQRCGAQDKVRDFGYHCGLAHSTETGNWLPRTDLSTG